MAHRPLQLLADKSAGEVSRLKNWNWNREGEHT